MSGTEVTAWTISCTVCGLPVDVEDCHQYHDAACRYRREAADYLRGDSIAGLCTCNAVAHPACCPQCGEEGS